MKESQDFIIEKLRMLFENIKGIKIRYEYRDFLSAHFIEVLPFDTFENDNEYLLAELTIQDEFEELFGANEEILFLSADSLNEIKNVQFSLGHSTFEKVKPSISVSHKFTFAGDFAINIEDSTSYPLAA